MLSRLRFAVKKLGVGEEEEEVRQKKSLPLSAKQQGVTPAWKLTHHTVHLVQ